MTARRQLWVWVCAAIAAVVFLIGMLLWERSRLEDRWNTFLQGDPKIGAASFQSKGCIASHAVKGQGGTVGPGLSLARSMPSMITETAGKCGTIRRRCGCA